MLGVVMTVDMERHLVLLGRMLTDRQNLVLIAFLHGSFSDEHLPTIACLEQKLARCSCLKEHALLHSTCFFTQVI